MKEKLSKTFFCSHIAGLCIAILIGKLVIFITQVEATVKKI
jgi:hypothetical protein